MHIDHKLLKACIKNKRKAQEELYEACYLFLIPICKRYHKNEGDARLVFNDAFLKIIKNLSELDYETVPFVAWAKRITINTLIDNYRKNKKYNEKVHCQNEEKKLEFFSKGTENNAESNFAEKNIMRLLDYLKPDTKQVFILYVIEGYKHKEISDILDMSEGTSKWHLSVARKELRALLEQQEKNLKNNLAI